MSGLAASPFFILPAEAEAFTVCLEAFGLTDEEGSSTSGFNALAVAVCSDWTQGGNRRRHVIAIFADAPTHPLEEGRYPAEFASCARSLDHFLDQ